MRKGIHGASAPGRPARDRQDLERFVFKMRKVYGSCEELIQVYTTRYARAKSERSEHKITRGSSRRGLYYKNAIAFL